MPRKRLLIDAVHEEELRAVLVDDGLIQEFEYEVRASAQIKGNVYLGVISRVEPSLQAAFVDYGVGRQGFLPFAEIHPGYYTGDNKNKNIVREDSPREVSAIEDDDQIEDYEDDDASCNIESVTMHNDYSVQRLNEENGYRRLYRGHKDYKIQDVVKRNTVVLVQVTKDERGNKGATLSTYIVLIGRYCVFMPNTEAVDSTPHRIDASSERLKMKVILDELNVTQGGSVLLRTAGLNRSLQDIRYDYNYLLNVWHNIGKKASTLTIPSFVYAESSLIKRVFRDFYSDDIESIVIAGKVTFAAAKKIASKIAPAAVAGLSLYDAKVPLFSYFELEGQIAALYDNVVNLQSGGYLVINQTEALVSIDVNSGRMTSERDFKETAFKTNMEAVDAVARHIKIRDLSGLIIVDFIDMHEYKHKRCVENRIRDVLKADRARIQLGRISAFGLLEMSRQRLGSSFLDNNTVKCSYCDGYGHVRNPISTAMAIFRAIENDMCLCRSAAKNMPESCIVQSNKSVILCIMNNIRAKLAELESAFNINITFDVDERLEGGKFSICYNERECNTQNTPNKQRGEYSALKRVFPGSVLNKSKKRTVNRGRKSKTAENNSADTASPSKQDVINDHKTADDNKNRHESTVNNKRNGDRKRYAMRRRKVNVEESQATSSTSTAERDKESPARQPPSTSTTKDDLSESALRKAIRKFMSI